MAETQLVVAAIAACGSVTLVILLRALRDVLTGRRKPERGAGG
jgi:hypothetical protein